MIFFSTILSEMHNYVQQMFKNRNFGEFQPVLAVYIRKLVAYCVIFSGVFNLRSEYKENGIE